MQQLITPQNEGVCSLFIRKKPLQLWANILSIPFASVPSNGYSPWGKILRSGNYCFQKKAARGWKLHKSCAIHNPRSTSFSMAYLMVKCSLVIGGLLCVISYPFSPQSESEKNPKGIVEPRRGEDAFFTSTVGVRESTSSFFFFSYLCGFLAAAQNLGMLSLLTPL